MKNPQVRIVPVAVGGGAPEELADVGRKMAEVIKARKEPVSIVVSSDMSHYISHDQAKAKDSLALQRILDLDPLGLYEVVRKENITMCGVLPMVVGLSAARALGASRAEMVAYSTSGEVNRDMSRVVGYAGVLVS